MSTSHGVYGGWGGGSIAECVRNSLKINSKLPSVAVPGEEIELFVIRTRGVAKVDLGDALNT